MKKFISTLLLSVTLASAGVVTQVTPPAVQKTAHFLKLKKLGKKVGHVALKVLW